jgi:tetratricopeptide (TPR) repeat protein
MGALYLAWDPTLEREIAIKLLREDNDDLRERFAREARSIARLRHPHIVMVFDVGVHEEQPFIAMEYIKGQTLAEIIGTNTPLTIVRKLQLTEELCDGLAYAHKAGIVHRDIKPANIMVDEVDGSLKLLDFGIARVGPGMTQAGMLIGTLSYMSPEQVTGSAVDGRSDIFAVGTVLYELLAGRQAFPGRLDTGVLHKILNAAPEPLQTLCPDLDPDIVEIVNRALEKDPAARYQELTTMRKDVLRVLRRLEAEDTQSSRDDQTILMPTPSPAAIAEPRLPTPTPRTPKGTDREALERRRAAQIETLLDAARKALDSGDHDAALARCEEVLLIDSDSARAWDLRDRAKAALDARQAEAWLDEAESGLDRGELDTAADLAQRSLELNPGAARGVAVLQRIDEARQERQQRQQRIENCRAAVSRARELLDGDRFTDAIAAADEALAIDPGEADALSVRPQAIDAAAAAARRRELADQRAKAAIAEAERLDQAGDPGAAMTLLDSFDPPHADVVKAGEALRAAIEARRREEARRQEEERRAEAERQERQRRVAAATERATVALSRQDFAAALEILRPLGKSDPDAPGLQALIAEAEAQRVTAERARQIAIEVRHHLDAASERLAAQDFTAAAQHVERALALDADHAEAKALAARIDASALAAAERREREARQQREREEAFAEAMARAERAESHDEAIAALGDALAVEPNDQKARRLLTEHRSALDQERRVAEALARAAAATSTEAAIAALRQALHIAPAHPEARRLLDEREADLARQQAEARQKREREEAEARQRREREEAEARQQREREEAEARQKRERDEAIGAAIREAAKAPTHTLAMAALQTALDIDPNHAEARRLFAAREAALQQEEAAERRRQEIEAACAEIDAQISRRAFDAAEQTIAAFERAGDAKKAMKPLRRQLKEARAAALKRAAEPTVLIMPVGGDATDAAAVPATPSADTDSRSSTGARSTGVYAAAAAAIVIFLLAGYMLMRQPASSPDVARTTTSPAAAPPPAAAPAPANDSRPAAAGDRTTERSGQLPNPAPAAQPPSRPAPVPEPPAAPVVNVESQVAPLRRLARQQFEAGTYPQALTTAMSGLKLAPADGELQRVVSDLSNAARSAVQRARQAAQAAGPAAVASAGFKDATARQELAARLARNRQVEPSLKMYWEAADLFTAAATQARASAATETRPSAPAPTSTPAPTTPAASASTQAPPAAVSAPPAPPPAATPPPATERPAPQPSAVPQQPPPRPQAPAANEESLIRSTLQTYVQAYTNLDVDAVKRTFPAVDAAALGQAFGQMRAQRIEIEVAQIATSGTTATARCQLRQHFEPKAGRVNDSVVNATFTLQKTAAGWIIVQRR